MEAEKERDEVGQKEPGKAGGGGQGEKTGREERWWSFEPMNAADIPCSYLSRGTVRQKWDWIETRLRLNARTGDKEREREPQNRKALETV